MNYLVPDFHPLSLLFSAADTALQLTCTGHRCRPRTALQHPTNHDRSQHNLGVPSSIFDSINVLPQLRHAHHLVEGTERQRTLSELALR